MAYHPFGGVKSFLFGNATTYSRSFDADGRISGYTLGNLTRTVGFDAASRITDFTHNDPAYDQAFGYDNLGRLRGWTSNTTSQSYGYDLTGNRTSLGIGAELYPYTVAPASNRLTQTDGPGGVKTFGHDAAGNTTSAGALAFGYDARGRMLSAATAIGPVSYQVNALGQRVAKQAPEATTVFHYDRAGRIIGESDAQGQTLREYVWLGGTPVAVIEANTAYFIHPDHLDTPRVVANQANTILWRWDSDPFGTTPPDEDPDGDGSRFELNLRFAGQYYDKETNLHYNYFRDYDPSIGRYVQSDPIGLEGGINTYAHVDGDPISYVDPEGLRSPGAQPAPNYAPRPLPPGPAGKVPEVRPEWRKDWYRAYREGYYNRQCANWVCPSYNPPMCTPSNPSGDPESWSQGPHMTTPGWNPEANGCRCVDRDWAWAPGIPKVPMPGVPRKGI